MVDTVRQLRLFIASPSDCNSERETVRSVCKEDPTILTICRANRISLDVFGWEDICSDMGRPQSIINMAVEKFNPDWFVFVFWHRFGSNAGLGMTGTEEEWNLARHLHEMGDGHPKVSIFFNTKYVLPHEKDDYQVEALKQFREKVFSKYEALACFFDGTKDFEKKFQAHLTEILMNIGGAHHEITIDRLHQELLISSNVLLNYPKTLGNDQHINRPELKEIVQNIEDLEQSATLILGSPGSGKSSLLSTLAHHLKDINIPLLAIKADTLSADIHSAEDLRRTLNLKLDTRDCVLALAERKKIVVIIDQLDAVSELLDRKSDRLNVLLNLVHSLSLQRNVHIIASSRDFEYRHDIRLNSIKAEKINLELPAWEQITLILEPVGHETNTMSDELKELLRTPLHLKIFLDVAKPGAVFNSLHALQQALWEQRVLAYNVPQDNLALLNELAMRMAEEESLWLPLACADNHPEACRFLEQNDILIRGQDGLTIGFRHQTYYDYTLSRAFASGSISLADYVFQRQDGLFVRPTLLSGLHYLRTTSISEYHKQLHIFFKTGLRTHLFSLLIEFLGSHRNPDDVEIHLLLPLLKSDTTGPKVLSAVIGSSGWFTTLRGYEGLESWMSKPVESAAHCVPFLSAAATFAGLDVFYLITEYWVNNAAYDPLTLNVLMGFKDWDLRTISVAERLVNRSKLWGTVMLIERIAEINPELAIRVFRAYLDGRLSEAIQEIELNKSQIKAPFDECELYSIRSLNHNSALKNLLENRIDYIYLESLAEDAPKAFLQWIWPWFLSVITQLSLPEHDFVLEYRSDTISYGRFERRHEETVVTGLLTAIKDLANTDTPAFLHFLNDNVSSDLLIVHRFLAQGLAQIVSIEPLKVLEYLLGDLRRLCLGDHNYYKDTKRLIAGIFPHLGQDDKLRLEKAILSFNRYRKVLPEWDVEDRRRRIIWNRQHRLRLLRAFPEEYLSVKTRQVRVEEERAFPGLADNRGNVSGGVIGPRLKVDEMAKASDDELINLFNKLPDNTEWDNPNRRWENFSRGGGSIQQSREFKELAKGDPHRVVQIITSLKPGLHETYAGTGLEGLAESDLPINELIILVEDLDAKGFSSEHFREGAASALEKRAENENGLPEGILLLLEKWLEDNPKPEWPETSEPKEEKENEIRGSILFGMSGLFFLPQGRGTILRAIATGYLNRQPPDINSWARIINNRLIYEQHPNVWALTMMHMPMLFNGNSEEATRIYNNVVTTCPKVLEKQVAFFSIAHVMPWCQPIELLKEWLTKIKDCSSDFNHQAYGEMLFLYHCHYQDSWSSERIMNLLAEGDDENILLGLACGASHLWHEVKNKTMAKTILCRLASHTDTSIQHAVADVFRYNRDYFQLNSDIKNVIQAILANRSILLMAANDLVELLLDYIGIEPDLVSEVCQEVLRTGGSDIGNISTSLALLAEPLTDIALTLHRHPAYREVGLHMFEDLILSNVRETRSAMDLLDRKPMKTLPPQYKPRRRRKARSK